VPAVHETQLALPLQTMLVPQLVPGDLAPLATHCEAPVAHEVAPFWQGSVGWHGVPAVQATQVPVLLQTWLLPQVVPVALVPLATHTDTPVAQDVAPVWQGLVGWHATPSAQLTQVPVLLQTMPEPQAVPAGWLPLATQTDAPVRQEVAPAWQGLLALGWHATPAVQGTQVPVLLQTMFVPQMVPTGWLPLATHCADPVEQDRVPVWHRLFGWQGLPFEHAPQEPALHTFPLPQSVPLGTGLQVPVVQALHVPQAVLQHVPETQ
jgi:hypothetical protein